MKICTEGAIDDKTAGVYVSWKGHTTLLVIADVNVVQDIYTTQNQYFDKHPSVLNQTFPLLGKSLIFGETNKDYHVRRKSISTAFYKGKLQ